MYVEANNPRNQREQEDKMSSQRIDRFESLPVTGTLHAWCVHIREIGTDRFMTTVRAGTVEKVEQKSIAWMKIHKPCPGCKIETGWKGRGVCKTCGGNGFISIKREI